MWGGSGAAASPTLMGGLEELFACWDKINMINIHHIATSTSPELQDFYLEDEKFMERLKKELDSNQWPEHFRIELEDWINGETPWDHVAIPNWKHK